MVRRVWSVETDTLGNGRRYRVLREGSKISFDELFDRLEDDSEFTSWYTEVLVDAPFEAYFWEHPPVTVANLADLAEFVLLDAPSLAQLDADPEPFRPQFERTRGQEVATFRNLGGDAVLIAPLPEGSPPASAHLGAFLRHAPESRIRCLWRETARAVRENLGDSPMWVSTAGTGVAWLHVRLDSYPKYYQFDPYTIGR
jgi:hypothetical protein